MPRYQPRSYGLIPVPQPEVGNPLATLSDLMNMAGGVQRLQSNRIGLEEQEREKGSRTAIEAALKTPGGNLTKTIQRLETGGRWTEANTLRQKSAEIRKAQQAELAERHKAVAAGFETATRYLQGIEAEPDVEQKGRLFDTVRPQIVEAMPGFDQYIPQSLGEDPGFVARAIPFGLSVTEIAKRRTDALEALNKKWKDAGDTLARDKAVLEHIGPFLDSADAGEEVEQFLTIAEETYGASPAVRTRIGTVPQGPLTPEWKAQLTERLTSPPNRETPPGSLDAAILVADRKGDKAEVKRLLGLKAQTSAAGREPDKADATTAATITQKASAERWKQGALKDLEDRYRISQGGLDEQNRPVDPMTVTDLETAKARIQDSYLEQIGGPKGSAAPVIDGATAKPRTPTAPPKPAQAATTDPAQVQQLLQTQKPGRYTLSDGSKWEKAADGTIRPITTK